MSETKKPTAVLIERGNYYFGHSTRDKDGNTTEKTLPRWEPDAKGSSIAICAFDTEKDETIGEADLFAAWDSDGLDKCLREKLALTRRNFPTPEELYRWIKAWDGRNIDICEICEGICAGYDCRVCPIQTIKDETEDGQ